MPDPKIVAFRRTIRELGRQLAVEQGHYPKGAPKIQHEMEREDVPSTELPVPSKDNG